MFSGKNAEVAEDALVPAVAGHGRVEGALVPAVAGHGREEDALGPAAGVVDRGLTPRAVHIPIGPGVPVAELSAIQIQIDHRGNRDHLITVHRGISNKDQAAARTSRGISRII